MGRKSHYTEDIPAKVKQWCEEGLIEKQIAAKIGISEASFAVWKNTYPDLLEALKIGKKKIDDGVENSLLKRAMGYDYEEVTTIAKNRGQEVFTEIHKTKKQVIPDVTAQIFWLKNRRKEEWRDSRNIDVASTGDLTIMSSIDFSKLTAEEAKQYLELKRKAKIESNEI